MKKLIAACLLIFTICTNSTLADSLDVSDLKVDLILDKAYAALDQQDIKIAWAGYLEARELATQLQNPLLEDRCEFLKAAIYNGEGLPERALAIYQFYIAKDNKASLSDTRTLLVNAHKTYSLLGDYEQAYQYLIAAEEVKEKIEEEKERQQAEYLSSKIEAEQKEKENALLAAQVAHKQSQQKNLFALGALFLLSSCLLIGTFLQKRKYKHRLSEEVISHTQELQHSNQELDEFNRILSHDLKEPLRSIVGFSTLASKEVFGNPRAMEYLSYIEKSGKQLHQIIEDVSTYQSIESYAESPLEWVDTNELLDFISKADDFQIEGKSLRLDKIDLRPVYANRSFVYLIFKNLLENGMKYNRHAEVMIQVQYEKVNGQHVFRFTDNGIGIAAEYHQKIFRMFKRLNDRRAYDGSGLGLSIVKKMVEKAEGSIALIASEEGRGSTFEVCLPVAATEETWARKRRMVEHV